MCIRDRVKAAEEQAPVILHHAEDTSHTVAWNITHCEDDAPTFAMIVRIYDLAGSLVATLEPEQRAALGPGSIDWDDELPEEDGIYTYKIVANHQDMGPPMGPCEDHDKSGVLVTTLERFYYFAKDVQAGTLRGVDRYTLNRLAADTVTIRFFDPDLEEFEDSALEGQDNSAGTHWSGVYTLNGVDFDQNDEPVGPIYCVLYAEESAADAANNRDLEPKPALQKGSTDVGLRVIDLDLLEEEQFHGDYEAWEESIGTVAVRRHDDNEAPREPIILREAEGSTWSGNVVLTLTGGRVSVWDAEEGGNQITFNGQDNKFADTALPVTLWVQGDTPSDAMRDVALELAVDGDPAMSDIVRFTVLWVTVLSDHTGSMEMDNAGRDVYFACVDSYDLGYHLSVSPATAPEEAVNCRGSEFIGVVQPSDFEPDLFSGGLLLARDLLSGGAWSGTNGNGDDDWIPKSAGDDTSPWNYRDDDPQSGGSGGRIYDQDMPGSIAFYGTTGHVFRIRFNFRAFASFQGIRCSEYLPWFTRQSYRKTGPWDSGTGTCDDPYSLTDDTKDWPEDAWVPGVAQIKTQGAPDPQARRVTANTAQAMTVRDRWLPPWFDVTYEVIAAPPDDPAWTLLNDVAGDNVSGDGATALGWDLQQ